MVIYSKIVKPLLDAPKNSLKWSLIRSLFCFIFAVAYAGAMFAISFEESAFNYTSFNKTLHGKIGIVCGLCAASIAAFIDIFELKYKYNSVKIFYYVLMLLFSEITIYLSLFHLWSFAIPSYEIMNAWMVPLVIATIYFISLLVLLNVLNHFMLIYNALNGSEKTSSKYTAPLRAFICILSFAFLLATATYALNAVSQNYHFYLTAQLCFVQNICFSVFFLSNGEEAKVHSRLTKFVSCGKSAMHFYHLLIPSTLVIVKVLCIEAYKTLTLSKIVLDFEKNKTETTYIPYKNFFAVIFFIYFISIGHDIWLKVTVEQDVLHSKREDDSLDLSKKIETDV